MPTYTFRDDSGKEFEITMTISERDQYVKDNPTHTQLITGAPMVASAHRMTNTKVGGNKGFKEVLNNIHKRTPGSVLNKTTDL